MMKKNRDVSKKRALLRWFTEKFIKENELVYEKIYSMLESTSHEIWLKVSREY